MKLRHSALALAVLGEALVGAGACSAASQRTVSSTGGAGGQASTDPGWTASGGSTCETHCSGDLHSVVDCDGTTVMTCPPDQGCGNGGCVSACESARLNKSTVGCDYYSVDPEFLTASAGSCFAAFIVNTWDSPVTLQVERAGQMLDAASFSYLPKGTGQNTMYSPLPNGQLAPGEVAIVFLAGTPSWEIHTWWPCPAGVGVGYAYFDAAIQGTGIGDAFHITTSAPVVAYDIFPYGGGRAAATSATLLIPTTAWDTNYVAVDSYAQSQVGGTTPFIEIVAAEDGTAVTIRPTAAIVGGNGVPPAAAGTPATYNLDKGQVLQLSQPAELLGSAIQANKPIGHWGGSACINIPVDVDACDSAHQQIPPVKALGHEYVAVRYRNRFDGVEESVPWRMVGAVDGITLTWDPAPPPGAPATLKAGELAEFRAAGPFSVASQDAIHPFYMSAHMTGCYELDPTGNDCRGDPEFVNVVPPQQYLSSYVFFTDPTYPETNLVVIRQKSPAGFQDVTLDCAGPLTGWTPVGLGGRYEYTRLDLVRHDFAPQGNCDNGRHEISSSGPFGLTVWGWGSAETNPGGNGFYSLAVSYAYPAGAAVQAINTVVVPTERR